MATDVTVLYLARLQDGIEEIVGFLRSYISNTTKIEHTLVVIVKGTDQENECAIVQSVLDSHSIKANLIWLSDEIGFDIDAYKWVTSDLNIQTELILCLKTSSKICSPDWLEKYLVLFSNDSVGLVGATGSYESLQSSWHAILNAQQKFFTGTLPFNALSGWKWIIGEHNGFFKLTAINSFFHSRRILERFKFRIVTGMQSNHDSVRERYIKVTRENEVFSFIKEFPLFPNPHIRTSGFMIRISDFNSLRFDSTGLKTDSSKFESGYSSLTRQIVEKNKEVLVLGADGRGYNIDEWEESGTFRNLDQTNLLISDNRTDDYPQMTTAVKKTHRIITWGKNEKLVEVDFSSQKPKKLEVQIPSFKLPSISIVIPTHNGNRLILETVTTVLNQSYPNLDLIVFDNASTTPISETLNHLDDIRLKIYRNDEFLSVTDSWNTAINFATSDYVMLFGDDDGLAPDFSVDFARYVKEFDKPDVFYSNLFQAIYPGVKGDQGVGEFRFHPVCQQLEDRQQPIFLDKLSRRTMVNNSLGLRRDFFYNMPSFIVKRSFLEEIRINGKVFLGPFPDYYIANMLFEYADDLLLVPKPLSFQGISQSSFGHSLMTGTTENGFKRLGESHELSNLRSKFAIHKIVHSNYVDEYVLTMLQLQEQLSRTPFRVDLKRYRKITIFNKIKYCISHSHFDGKKDLISKIVASLRASGKLRLIDYVFVTRMGILFVLASKFPRIFYRDLELLQHELQIMQYQPDTFTFTELSPHSPIDTFKHIAIIQTSRKQKIFS